MNRYLLLHRMTGPSILLLLGIVALLHQAHLVSWNIFLPLLLILIGVLKLAQRAALADEPYPGAPYAGPINPAPGAPQPPAPPAAAPTHDFDPNAKGGQS